MKKLLLLSFLVYSLAIFAQKGISTPSSPKDGPNIVVVSYDNTINFGQMISMDIVLQNTGTEASASNVLAIISTTDPDGTITNPAYSYGIIEAGETTDPSFGVFNLTASISVEDQHEFLVEINISDGTNTWVETLSVIADAPAILIQDMFITNDASNDGVLDPGESGDINIYVKNTGHKAAVFGGVLSKYEDPNDYLTLGNTSVSGIGLAPGDSAVLSFVGASADASTPPGTIVEIQLDATAGDDNQYTAEDIKQLSIGPPPVYLISDAGPYTVCMGTFYDTGGPDGQYQNGEDETLTFLVPADKDFVVVNFLEYETETNYDKLYVHDGPDVNSPQIAGSPFDTGNPPTEPIMGANGLTFHFTSDASVTKNGWLADISCYSVNQVPDCPTNPIPENNITNVFPDQLSWAVSMGATSYDVYFGTNEDPFVNTPVNVTSNEFSTSFSPNTTYYWVVIPINNIGQGTACDVWTFTTGAEQYLMQEGTITTCNGVFYDTGGPDGNYQNGEDITMTILPGGTDNMMEIEFVEFECESGYDHLGVYDGIDATNLIGEYDTGNPPPTTITATNTEGALTFVFHSDGSISKPGWVANLSCTGGTSIPECAENPVPENGATTSLPTSISWDASANATSYDVYFGTDVDPYTNTPVNVTTTEFALSSIEPNMTYYWAIIPMNEDGAADACEMWSFTTIGLPDCAENPVPENGALMVFPSSISWDASAGATSYDVYFGTDIDPYTNTPVNVTTTEFALSSIEPNMTYYWAIIPMNEDGAADACEMWSFTTIGLPDCAENPVPENGALMVFPSSISWDASAGATSYDVYFGTDIDPYTNTPVNVTTNSLDITPENDLTYYWAVSPINEAGTTTGCDVWSFTTTPNGITEFENNIRIVPNPSNGLFSINLGSINPSQFSIKIMNINGQIVYYSNTMNVQQIDLSKEAKGIYFLSIIWDNNIYNTKIMLK